ncbi:MAG: TIGR03643 family protein [Verrucomicrobiales bacterium]|nr:TIGR03643 family protein [Verrucomicrobiales bacterium]
MVRNSTNYRIYLFAARVIFPMSRATIDKVIGMAWADRVSFEEIEKSVGLSESEVIDLMRRELRSRSFRLWRKRVSGRKTKHRKLFKQSRKGLSVADSVDY